MQRDWRDFKALYGNIEGAREGFEKACETLFRKVYAPQHVSQMAVKQGDGGVDIFVGKFSIEPIVVIQCKFFLESFGDSQKAQIRDSFNRAKNSDKYELEEWVLVLPRVIDIDENSWWFKWAETKDVNIRLINGNELIDLMKEDNVYNQIFQIDDSRKIDEIHKALIPEKNKIIPIEKDSTYIFDRGGYIEPKTVYIEDLNIHVAVCPVTIEEYTLFCKNMDTYEVPYGNKLGKKKRPVVNVNINNVYEYCKWLKEKCNKNYRLLESKNWESIARQNMPKENLESYIVTRENFKKNPKICNVGSKKAGRLNIFDMPGNIYEWCDNLNTEKAIIKGSTFNTSIENIDICKNDAKEKTYKSNRLGFRIIF